jgi:hypothetical protein
MPTERRQPPEPRRLNAGEYGRVDKTRDRLPSGAPPRGIEHNQWPPPATPRYPAPQPYPSVPPQPYPSAYSQVPYPSLPYSDPLTAAYSAIRPPRPQYAPPPTGIPGPMPLGGGGAGPPIAPRSDLVLEITKEFASRIIGPGGGTVKGIRAAAGAHIHIDKEPLPHAKGMQLLRVSKGGGTGVTRVCGLGCKGRGEGHAVGCVALAGACMESSTQWARNSGHTGTHKDPRHPHLRPRHNIELPPVSSSPPPLYHLLPSPFAPQLGGSPDILTSALAMVNESPPPLYHTAPPCITLPPLCITLPPLPVYPSSVARPTF